MSLALALLLHLVWLWSMLQRGDCHQPFLTSLDFERSTEDNNVTFLSDKDFANAKKYKSLLVDRHSDKNYILTHQKYFRGDIRGKAQWISKLKTNGKRRNGVVMSVKKWPGGRIPYVLSTQYNDRERAVLARAFDGYHRQTCIRFVPKQAYDRDFLYIGKIDGCYSDVGKAGGRQELSLDDGCIQYDTIIHELMHSVGFYHEHERWDRDHFISILWQNIDKEAYDQFGRVDLTESSYYGQVYDYKSVMHYDSLAFSKNGKETLVAKQPGMTKVIGSAVDFSPSDLIKIKKMYACSQGDMSPVATGSSMLPDKSLWTNSITRVAEPAASLQYVVNAKGPNPASECSDRSTLCYRWLDRCQSKFFEKIMKEFCSLSCGFCVPSRPSWRSYPGARLQKSSYDYSPQTPQQASFSGPFPVYSSYQVPSKSLPWYQIVG